MIIGHERQQKLLARHRERGTLSHAYLFSGPEHVGKAAVTRAFMQHIACDKKLHGDLLASCGSCASCQAFVSGRYPNLVQVFSVSEDVPSASAAKRERIGIDEIRSLKERAVQTSLSGWPKFFVVDDAADMTREAANSILKILEEPPGDVVFVLITSHASDILSTIRSRLWEIKFWPVSASRIEKALVAQGIGPRKATHAARVSFGLPGLAISRAVMSESDLEAIEKHEQDLRKLFSLGHMSERLQAIGACEERQEYADILGDFVRACSGEFDEKIRAYASGANHTGDDDQDIRRLAQALQYLSKLEAEIPRLWVNMRLAFESAMLSV